MLSAVRGRINLLIDRGGARTAPINQRLTVGGVRDEELLRGVFIVYSRERAKDIPARGMPTIRVNLGYVRCTIFCNAFCNNNRIYLEVIWFMDLYTGFITLHNANQTLVCFIKKRQVVYCNGKNYSRHHSTISYQDLYIKIE